MSKMIDAKFSHLWRASIPVAIAAAWLASSGAAHAETALEKIKRQGHITVGYRDDAAPFSFTDGQKNAAGYGDPMAQPGNTASRIDASRQMRLAPSARRSGARVIVGRSSALMNRNWITRR